MKQESMGRNKSLHESCENYYSRKNLRREVFLWSCKFSSGFRKLRSNMAFRGVMNEVKGQNCEGSIGTRVCRRRETVGSL